MKTEVQESEAVSDDLKAYISDRGLLWRNVSFILFLSLGWAAAFTYINPLMQLKLKEVGVSNSTLGFISGSNAWIYSYLVMYFAWKSDHTVSRFGRRLPFLMISAPVIIGVIIVFPMFAAPSILIGLYMLKAIFMDIKAATIPLLNIDCVPRGKLARINSLNAMVLCATSFFALRYGMGLADHHPLTPYVVGAVLLTLTTITGVAFIKEPPVIQKKQGRFLPWSAMKVAWQDKKAILLMAGVGFIYASMAIYTAWIWLYADQKLGITRGQLGEVMAWGTLAPFVLAYPAGWLIDRYRGMRIVVLYWLIALFSAWWIGYCVSDAFSLGVAALAVGTMGPLYAASDIKVYREADPRDVGSITSTNSCLRGLISGGVVALSGLLIEHAGGDYRVAFIFGAAVSTLGLCCIFIHTHLSKKPVLTEEVTLVTSL